MTASPWPEPAIAGGYLPKYPLDNINWKCDAIQLGDSVYFLHLIIQELSLSHVDVDRVQQIRWIEIGCPIP